MEIERKYLIQEIPEHLPVTRTREIEQGYLNTDPVVRIRRDNERFELTCKSRGLMVREEYTIPLTREAYEHLCTKIDGQLIRKTRKEIPLTDSLTAELDIFHDQLAPLVLAEVEFPSEEEAYAFVPPDWFGRDVTFSSEYHNSTLSRR